MFAQRTGRHAQRRVPAAVAMILVGLFAASLALARVTANTIDSVASVTDHGRHLIVTGPIGCTAGERAHLRVTVTQRTTGAVAEGRALINCTGSLQQWEVHASVQGSETFEEGPAVATALSRTTDRGNTTDAHQWLVAITLEGRDQ